MRSLASRICSPLAFLLCPNSCSIVSTQGVRRFRAGWRSPPATPRAACVNVLEARRGRRVSDVAAWADASERDTQVAKCVDATFTALGRSSYPTCAGLRSRGWVVAGSTVSKMCDDVQEG
ncbi:hypothetical protein OH77DRAFT_1419914 [Trametes cingulata]|nr:hypothetical protein OH77DRAFT_1419914 [Trametes cingulata]